MANTFTIEFEDGVTKSVSVKIKPPTDIIQFVPGTTDPVNTKGLNHQANEEYWLETDLLKSVKKLKPQYNDLHIASEFFSWSGDNNTDERNKAADRLLDLILRVYKNWTRKELHFHLIGHSHGGNVINQFTELIANKEDFPKYWKIKSITYLSTPFFKEQHQLNHTKLHPKCKIINVHNEYDITQRFVADFTLKNLEYLIENFQDKDKIEKAIEALKSMDLSAYEYLTDLVINNHTEGPAIWKTTYEILIEVEKIMKVIKENIAFIGKRKIVSLEKQEFLSIFDSLLKLITARKNRFNQNQKNREDGYGRTEFLGELELTPILPILNRILDIKTDERDSYLLKFLDSIFTEDENGIVQKIDDTSWTPKNQTKEKFKIEDFNITDLEPYDKKNKKSNFDKFAKGIEDAMKRNDDNSLKEILMRMISQFIIPINLEEIIMGIVWFERISFGVLNKNIEEVNKNLTLYHKLIKKYYADLITKEDSDNTTLEIKQGSIIYLAKKSHSLSHTKLFDDPKHNVKEALTSAFSSGENPGFK